ncbi:MAG TPA: acyl-CoA ligase (AMP-forming), exosortase A system-associated [Steroidobacteraceae bacterium]|nr:acyl-CoA ligase (AMP-forming), exosortase A system-associated [Steroidobacteraceae bacterium]
MTALLHDLPAFAATRTPDAVALRYRTQELNYAALAGAVDTFAAAVIALGVERQERIAIFLPKQFETVIAMFGATRAGCVFVPVNPILKGPQVQHILRDCNVRVLVTSPERLAGLGDALNHCPDLRHLIIVGGDAVNNHAHLELHAWNQLLAANSAFDAHHVIDMDMAAILYTSGSTGKPKGVVLSHRNMVTGAHSVAQYLENRANDRLLAVLPFSFDYGFSQLSTAFHVGANVVLLDHLFPRDVVNAVAKENVTGLAAVPPLWSQLADLQWPDAAKQSLRYITNSGGAMPGATLQKLRVSLPNTQPFLMYGLTEAFRSTYLPPSEIDKRPGSMGKAIPNAEILVVRPDGSPCAANEPGELVHRGSLVALGYWNDPVKTAERYKPMPNQNPGLVLTEMAVWSGDTVRRDEDGFLYFIGRRDEMIKTSGYRVSPSEIEEVIFATGLVADAAAVGVTHPTLGQAIVVVAAAAPDRKQDTESLLNECKKQLPPFMVPARIEWRDHLPRNPNGKYDRPKLAAELQNSFLATTP